MIGQTAHRRLATLLVMTIGVLTRSRHPRSPTATDPPRALDHPGQGEHGPHTIEHMFESRVSSQEFVHLDVRSAFSLKEGAFVPEHLGSGIADKERLLALLGERCSLAGALLRSLRFPAPVARSQAMISLVWGRNHRLRRVRGCRGAGSGRHGDDVELL